MTRQSPICVALDTSDAASAALLARALKPYIGFVKIGMELFYAQGAKGYKAIADEGVPVFLDLKLHDIPSTVAQGIKSLLKLSPPPAILNIHATGGPDMMKAAVDAVEGRAKLIAVTVLTSLSDDDLWTAGFDPVKGTALHARNLAELAFKAGLDGVVCSSLDVESVRAVTNDSFLTVVPGIRPDFNATQDQKRVATPASALAAGASILVIGRPITGAQDPVRATQDILESVNDC